MRPCLGLVQVELVLGADDDVKAWDKGAVLGGLGRKFMSCSHCQEHGQLADLTSYQLFLLLCSQSGASLLVDPTLDNDYNS